MRGAYPYDVFLNKTGETFGWSTTLAEGIPDFTMPDLSSGRIPLPVGVFTRTPEQDNVNRGIIQQWNVAFEQRLPWNLSAEIAYVGTRTDGGYADLNINYGEPGGGNASRKYFAIAGTTTVNSWGSRTKSRYKGLQFALNRPFRNGLMLKGAYTLSQAKDMTTNGEDGWVGLTWNHPLKYDDNFDIAVFDRTHIAQLGFLYELPFFKESKGALHAILGGWQVNGIAAWYSGTPYSIAGTNTAMNCQGCGSILINYAGDKAEPVGSVGSGTETYYDKSLFSQPTGTDYAGFGNTGRTFFRRPNVWNVDLSALQGVPGRAGPPGDPDRGRERVQPPELGRSGYDVHREQLPAVHSGLGGQRQRHRVRLDQHAGTAAHPGRRASGVLARRHRPRVRAGEPFVGAASPVARRPFVSPAARVRSGPRRLEGPSRRVTRARR